MKTNILLVGALIVIAAIIVALSFVMRPMPSDSKVQRTAAVESKSPAPPVQVQASAPAAVTPTQPAIASVKQDLEKAFDKGLSWLMQKQLPSGSFPDLEGKDDVAFTSMALIILGESPEPSRLKYKDTIDKGITYLTSHSQENGSIMDAGKNPSFDIYKTSLGIVALKTLLPYCADEMKKKSDDAVAKAVDYLQKCQYGPESGDKDEGGWGYKEKEGEKTPSTNLSTTVYVLDALNKSGLPKDSETYKHAIDFLMKCQDSSEYNKYRATTNSGGFAYSPVESKAGEETTPDGKKILKPYGSMTYAGLLSFIYAYVDKNDPRVQSAYNWIRGKYNLDENPGLRTDAAPQLGKQGLFYYYHTFAKALSVYGEKKLVTTDNKEHLWAEDLVRKLAAIQSADGSWKNENSRWWEDMPLLATSYSLMSLNICRKWVE